MLGESFIGDYDPAEGYDDRLDDYTPELSGDLFVCTNDACPGIERDHDGTVVARRTWDPGRVPASRWEPADLMQPECPSCFETPDPGEEP